MGRAAPPASAPAAPPSLAIAPAGSAVLTFFRLAPFSGPGGADEARHRRAARQGQDASGEFCVAPADGEVFDRLAALVRDARPAAPTPDTPFAGGLVHSDGTTMELRTAMDTVMFAALAGDGRSLPFTWGGAVKDLDGQLYDLPEEVWEQAQAIVVEAIRASGACPDSVDWIARM